MLYANNPEIDFDMLAHQIAEDMQNARPTPPFLGSPLADLQQNQDRLLSLVIDAERLLHPQQPRGRWWTPLSWLAAKLTILLFFRERQALGRTTAALREQIGVNRALAKQITALTDYLSRDV